MALWDIVPKAPARRPPGTTGPVGGTIGRPPPGPIGPTGPNGRPTQATFWSMTPRQRQTILKNLGYNVTVDGLPGPQTLDASKAYMAGVAPGVWNKRNLAPGGGTVTPRAPSLGANTTGASPTSGDPSTRAGMGLPRGASQADIPGYVPGNAPSIGVQNTSPGSLMGDLEQLGYTNIDPNKYAETIANLQYDGPINELVRQRALAESRGIGAQTSLTDWYNQLMQQKDLGIADREAAFKAGSTGLQAAGKGLMSAFGGGANDATGPMGSDVLNQVAGLTGINQAASNFDSRLGGIFSSQEADSKNAARLQSEQEIQNLAQQLIQMRQDKGNAQGAALYQGYGLNQQMMGNSIDMLGNIRNMDTQNFQNRLAAAKFPQDWTTQNIQNQGAIQNMGVVGALAPAQIAQANANVDATTQQTAQARLDYRTTNAQFKQWLAQHSGRGQIIDPTGNPLSAPQLNAFSDKIVKSLLNPTTGQPTVGSNAAFGQITSMIRGSGLNITQPAVQQFRQMVLRTLFPGVQFGPKGNPVRTH